MGSAELLAHALAKPGAWPDYPWGGDEPVVKVGQAPGAGKIFVFVGGDGLGVKCGATRDEADEWLARHPDDAAVMAYIGRSGWNSLTVGSGIPDEELLEAVDVSYHLVVSRLARKHRPEGWDRG